MKLYETQFLSPERVFTRFATAAAAILPVPYEGGVSYGTGAGKGPDAILAASHFLELYDEILKAEPFRMGIATVVPPAAISGSGQVLRSVFKSVRTLIDENKWIVMLGGDHSVSPPSVKALLEKFGRLSVIQLDAHADLREQYNGSPHSHACVMSRIRELTANTLQIGIRSMSREEADRIKEELAVCTMADWRRGKFDVDTAVAALPDPVYITLDVDVLDWSVVRSTGTPEPGGLMWDETIALLRKIILAKNVIGFDVVEFAYQAGDLNSPFAVAKLIYKMLGFKLYAHVQKNRISWPDKPEGPLFDSP